MVRWLAYRSFRTARQFEWSRRRPRLAGIEDPVLVYQMGKVGSSAVVHSLGERGLPALQIHGLRPEFLAKAERLYARSFPNKRFVPGHLLASRYVVSRLERRRWTVVTLVRDPVARNVSSFFQVLARKLPPSRYARLDSISTESLAALFLRLTEHRVPLEWFDREPAAMLGIDVFERPFDAERGYAIFEGDRARLLLLKLEGLAGRVAPAFREFLGLAGFRLARVNVGGEKDYAGAYRRFCREVRLPEDYLEEQYGSRLARHFYSPAEIEAFRRRWR